MLNNNTPNNVADNLVDCREMDCPLPVINVKKVLDELTEGRIVVLVDNLPAKENVLKLAVSNGCNASAEECHGHWRLTIVKTKLFAKFSDKDLDKDNRDNNQNPDKIPREYLYSGDKATYLITKRSLGHGSEELGEVLMKSLFFTVGKTPPLPSTIIFLNSGAYLTCEGSPMLEYLKALEEQGVEILTCGTCLNYYKLENNLVVGTATNMYDILEKINRGRCITL